jgi:hypothetical protein
VGIGTEKNIRGMAESNVSDWGTVKRTMRFEKSVIVENRPQVNGTVIVTGDHKLAVVRNVNTIDSRFGSGIAPEYGNIESVDVEKKGIELIGDENKFGTNVGGIDKGGDADTFGTLFETVIGRDFDGCRN